MLYSANLDEAGPELPGSDAEEYRTGIFFPECSKELKNNAKEIEAGPTFGIGIDNDGVVYEWGTLTDRLKQIPADMGKVVDIAVGQDHVLAMNEEGNSLHGVTTG